MRYFPNPYEDPSKVAYDTNATKANIAGILSSLTDRNNLGSCTRDVDGGLYVGPAGIAYALWYAAKNGAVGDPAGTLRCAHDIIKFHASEMLRQRGHDRPAAKVGFLIGQSGVHAVHAVISSAVGEREEAERCLQSFAAAAPIACTEFNGRNGSDELLVGRAGYVMGALWLRQHFGASHPLVLKDDDLVKICAEMIKSGRNYSARVKSPCPLMYQYHGTEYLGAAHGVCSILQMLLSVPLTAADARAVRAATDYMLSIQEADGSVACAMDEVPGHCGFQGQRGEENSLVHWCHGAPGVVFLFVKAWEKLREEKYREAALRCGENVWQRGLLKKGPGICHGVAGSGYVFLLLYRMTRDPVHLQRANSFAHFMTTPVFQRGARRPDCPFSLYEGTAGTLCFLTDLLNPDRAEFPFFDVFS